MKLLIGLILSSAAFAQSTLSLSGPSQIKAGSTIALSVSLAGGGPAAIQFSITTSTDITGLSAAVTGSATSASKAIVCGAYSAGALPCVLYGINATGMVDGTIVNLTAVVSPSPVGKTIPFTISSPLEASPTSTAIATTVNPFPAISIVNSCDVNGDGLVNAADVTLIVNQVLAGGGTTCDVNKDSACNVLDVQVIATAAAGGACAAK